MDFNILAFGFIKLPPYVRLWTRPSTASIANSWQRCTTHFCAHLLDVCSNSVCHVLLQVAQEAACDDGAATECDRDEPDILQRLSICPSATVVTSCNNSWGDTWNLSQALRSSQEGANECLSRGQWETSSDGALGDVGGETRGQAVDEDVVARIGQYR